MDELARRIKNVGGFLSLNEARLLERYAEGRVVLEVGSFMGRSTVAMLPGCVRMTCIDHFRRRPGKIKRDAEGKLVLKDTSPVMLAKFLENTRPWRYKLQVVVADSTRAVAYPWGPADMLFIDGGHDYRTVKSDMGFVRFVRANGVVACHDVNLPGVARAIREELAGWKELAREKKIATLVVYGRKGEGRG